MKCLLSCLCAIIMLPALAQNDVTNTYIKNAGFDDGTMVNNAPAGWTLELTSQSGVKSKISTGEKGGGIIAANQNHWQLYQWNSGLTGEAYQKITVPNAHYKLAVTVSANFDGSLNVYANNKTTPVISGSAQEYAVEVDVTNGILELGIGFAFIGTNCTIDFDSFKLYRTQSDSNDLTDKYLVNPYFDDGTFTASAPRGWQLNLSTSGCQSKISTGEKGGGAISGGQNHWQLWQQHGSMKGKAYQLVENIPIGRYKLSAVIVPSVNGELSLYLNNSSETINPDSAATYTVEGLVYDNSLELGIDVNAINGATIDVDSFKLYKVDLREGDYAAILSLMKQKCESDIADTSRQAYYNELEVNTACQMADAATDDKSRIAAVTALQQAHKNFLVIKEVYATTRDAVTVLYNKTKGCNFVLNKEIKQLYDQMLIYYAANENQQKWMKEQLSNVARLDSAYNLYNIVNLAILTAQNQLDATNYDGRAELEKAIKKAYDAAGTATTIAEYKAIVNDVQIAQAAYLKNRPNEWVTIQNGQMWMTNDNISVQAHAPGFLRVGDIWYMCGEDRSGWWNPDVNLYSSTDLVHWKFENKIVKNGVTTPELGHGRFIERPKLLYNEKTGKYVVWCHYEQGNYGASEAACFECDSVNGNYHYVWSGRPLNVKSRDCNVFQDNDGAAYFISTTNENRDLGLFRLSEDYHGAVEHTVLFAGNGREAPAIVRVGDRYFMLNSACSGWEPNQCKMSHTTKLTSGWSGLANVGNYYAYDTQAAAILTIKGTKTTTYLYVGERWQDPGLPESKTIIFPISFDGTNCNFTYRERFDINFVTGEWRETPTDGIIADRTGWTIVDKSSENPAYPATNAIDGNEGSFWRSGASEDESSNPQYLTIDMGKETCVKGFVIIPRLDYFKGLIRNYMFLGGNDINKLDTLARGNWLPYWNEVDFVDSIGSVKCRYIKIVKTDGKAASLAEINVVLAAADDPSTSISSASAVREKKIIVRTYYTLDGRAINAPEKGFYIEKVVYEDGTVKSMKKIRK